MSAGWLNGACNAARSRDADGGEQHARGCVLQDLVGVPVHQVHGVVGADVDVMSVGRHPVRTWPGGQQVPVGVEHQHGRPLPLEHVDPVAAVHGDAADASEALADRQPGPLGLVFVNVVAHAHRDRHVAHLRGFVPPAQGRF